VSRGLVVAKYKEDVSWLDEVPREIKVYIYDKSPVGELVNEGRDAHTFLHHMVEHYDDLDDWTVFAQGWPFDHCNRERFFRELVGCELDFQELGDVKFSVVGNGLRECGNLPLTEYFGTLVNREVFTFSFVWGMQVVLSKRVIRALPKSLYEKMRDDAIEFYKDPFTLPILERVWCELWRYALQKPKP